MRKKQNHFGEHLTVDCYEGNSDKLNNRNLIFESLRKLSALLKFNRLININIFFVKGAGLKDEGWWVGTLVAKESHINIHTFPNKNFLGIDIYNSKDNLDKNLIISYLKGAFDITKVKYHIFKGGIVNKD